jgi:hypothetical protein
METKTKNKFAKGSSRYSEVATGDVDRKLADMSKNIPGWGIDADPENDPTYPMKHANGADHERIHYQKPTQQISDVEILQSIERPSVTAVFGTSVPPTGLSGQVRRFAYKFSEADARHWMSLLLADRINVVEGVIDDLKHGIVPNFFAERGWTAEWKYNRKGAIKNLAVRAAVATAIVALIIYRNKSKNRRLLAS